MPDLTPIVQKLLITLPGAVMVLVGATLLNLLLARGVRLLAAKTSFDRGDLMPFQRFGRWLINGAAFVLLLGVCGFNLGGLWAMMATLLGMVAIGFVAVWSVLSNALCTFIILVCRPFEVGDELEFPGEPTQGRVTDLNFIYTTLLTPDGSLIQIPNNLFLQRVIKRRRGRVKHISLAEQLAASDPAPVEAA